SVLFFVLHIFRMTVFFVLAGFFARLLLEKRGFGGFIANRAKRIATPLLVFWPISIAGIVAVAIWAAVQANGGAMPEGPPPPSPTAETFPLTHLWFLYVLLFFYAGALALSGIVRLVDRSGALRARLLDPLVRAIAGPAAPVLLAMPVATALYFTPNWYMWFGIPTPDHGLIPNASALVIYGSAFGFGWLLNRQPDILKRWSSVWLAYTVAAIAASAACLAMTSLTPMLTPADQGLNTLGFAALYAFASWAWTLGLIGFAVRHLSGESRARRYLADASYWIYLVHLPLVMALQTVFAPYDWPWFAKYPLILAIAFLVMLASYQWLVRYSFVGAILSGRKTKPPKAKRGEPQFVAAE
ncbi:MAG TPA: acyltransferase family protein, partial [Candidatus Binatia bacterium]|nr:acyltransferase family protein [Candidatus Binatia bacterium]